MKPVMSVAFSDLYKHPTWWGNLTAMQPRAVMWLIGGEPPDKSGARASYTLCPNSWIVLRLMQYEPAFSPDQIYRDPDGVASRWRDCISDAMPYIADPARTIVCGPVNECKPTTPVEMQAYARMESLLCFLAWETLGIRSMIGNFSVGTPDPALMLHYYAALQAAHAYHGVLGLHQYMQLTAGDEAIWTSQRDQLWEAYLDVPQCSIPIMVTETGEEQIWNPGDPGQAQVLQRLTGGRRTPGWKTAEDAFRFRGFDQPLGDCFVAQLRALAQAYAKRTRIKAAFVFMSTREEGWTNYDPEPVMPQLVEWIGAEPLRGLTSLDPYTWLESLPLPPPAPDPDPVMVEGIYRVTAQRLNVRNTPTAEIDTNKVHVLKAGDLVEVQNVKGDWAEIAAFVNKHYIEREP